MIRFSPVRRVISGVPRWRCLQHIRGPGFSTNVQSRFPPRVSSALMSPTPTPPCRLLGIGPLGWPSSRLCHGDPRGTSERGKGASTLRALAQAPKPALYIGLAGLTPFLSAPLLMAATQSFHPDLAYAQVVYGAAIVSFLGGARWGFAIPAGSPSRPDWKNLGNSVVPALLAWVALLCRDNVAEGALVVLMGLGLSLHYDLTLLPGYPSWFKAMRTILTLVATFSLVATLAIKQSCSEKSTEEIPI